jgi:hypothetical protein
MPSWEDHQQEEAITKEDHHHMEVEDMGWIPALEAEPFGAIVEVAVEDDTAEGEFFIS